MPQAETLRKRIRVGEILVALRESLATSKSQLADIWATGRYDYIWIDGQHTAFSEADLVKYCLAAEELGIDVQLRIPHTRYAYLVGRYFDFGLRVCPRSFSAARDRAKSVWPRRSKQPYPQ